MKNNFESKMLSNKTEAEKNMENLVEDLGTLSSTESLSGQETKIRNHLKGILDSLGLKCLVDEKGNLWVKSEDKNQKNILLCAHMDKVGAGKKAILEGNRLRGRLDDALGLSVILQLIKQGFRPSILFTVEEESKIEIEKDGKTSLEARKLPDNIYNAGARYAAEKLTNQSDKPKLIIVVDVTKMGQVGNGPIVYTSSGLKRPGKQFPFPQKMLKNIAKIINPSKSGISYLEGNANDSIEFTFVPEIGVLAIEIPVENNHTNNEEANFDDVEKAMNVLRRIIENADKI